MAHAATLTGLAENLVEGISGLQKDDRNFARVRDRTTKGLRDQSHARTNQFAVQSHLDGLVEKFTVLNRDDLAEGLQSRLDELPKKSKWMPEILSLLLELSDRPAEKTQFANVENANKRPDAPPELTWEEIVADDPLDEPDIWDTVDRGYHSSGEDDFDKDDESEATSYATATSGEDDPASIARLYLMQPDGSALDKIKATRRNWHVDTAYKQSLVLSELTAIREMLSMLRGLTTDLFRKDEATGRVTISRKVAIQEVSKSSLLDVLESAATTGRALNSLRKWSGTPLKLTYQQSLQASTQDLLSTFDKRLASLEQRFASPVVDTVVSASEILTGVQNIAAPLLRLALLTQLSSMAMGPAAPFALLDYLYDEVGIAQMAGDLSLLKALGPVLFAGLRSYFRPVYDWITAGTISATSDASFLVKDANPACEPSNLWHGRYELRTQPDGTPLAPKCLLIFARKMFALGKGQSFLSRLESNSTDASHIQNSYQARLPDFATIREALDSDCLMPFSQLFEHCVESWIASISTDCTPVLQSKLLREHGFTRAINALPHVFFSKDGMLFRNFAGSLFDRMSATKSTEFWSSQFLLMELAQTTLGASQDVDGENIDITLPKTEHQLGVRSLSISRKLGLVKIGYFFPWPVQNITGCQTPEAHTKVAAFLLQLQYAATMLRGRFFDLRANDVESIQTLRLRQSFLWFVDLFQQHAATTAHQVHASFWQLLDQADDIDKMVIAWAEYIRRLETTLLLTTALQPIRSSIIDILELIEAFANTTQSRGISALQNQFDKALHFLVPGIRSISRAGGEPTLEALAEKLEWGIRSNQT